MKPPHKRRSDPTKKEEPAEAEQSQEKEDLSTKKMTYDEWRLEKHKRKASQRPKKATDEPEPEFSSYKEYRQWKLDQKIKKEKEQEQAKGSEPASGEKDEEIDEDLFQHKKSRWAKRFEQEQEEQGADEEKETDLFQHKESKRPA